MNNQAVLPFGNSNLPLKLPSETDVLCMTGSDPLSDPVRIIKDALVNPIASKALSEIVRQKIESDRNSKAVVVISDNTRPVPYKGGNGILWPVIEILFQEGIQLENILILVATGTHRVLTDQELRNMIDSRIFELGIKIENHDCRDEETLTYLGNTRRGSRIQINRKYLEADIKILTGLVESHFMAGTSGGRKSICPGLVGEQSTYVFHGAPMMSDKNTKDLLLDGNPCHEEALEVALTAGADFIINVTLNHDFELMGVFAGDLQKAHLKAVENLKTFTAIPVDKKYDIVICHAGFVGINHYQAAKAGTAAAAVIKKDGYVFMVADNTDVDPIGGMTYRTVLQLLKLIGTDSLKKLLHSDSWTFIPEQWQVQMWSRLFSIIPMEHFYYYSPQFDSGDYRVIPGNAMTDLIPDYKNERVETIVETAVKTLVQQLHSIENIKPSIAYLQDGPYGIPIQV